MGRQIEGELAESRNAVNEMNTINSKASAEKRHIEGLVHTMHAEIDDMLQQAKNSEEKAKKAMVDAARLADELRAEQCHVNTQSKAKRSLETQLLELENRLAEANENAIRGGRAWPSTPTTYAKFCGGERKTSAWAPRQCPKTPNGPFSTIFTQSAATSPS